MDYRWIIILLRVDLPLLQFSRHIFRVCRRKARLTLMYESRWAPFANSKSTFIPSGRSTNLRDAGAGPASGSAGQTTGISSAKTNQHPPTDTINRATGDVATSSQDVQKQMQGQPTAAQQAQGAKPSATADQGC
jgi:hypothetical protein